jgi:hypothetical protein
MQVLGSVLDLHALDFKPCSSTSSELVQLKLNIETSVGESTPTEAEYEVPLPLVEVGVSRLDQTGEPYD